MRNRSVLVVDDNAINLALLSAVLRANKIDVRLADSAAQALAAIAESPPAMILMDLQMPEVDGLTLTRQLRAAPGGDALIVIAVTSYAMKGDREKALAAGCDDFVTKPIDTKKLPVLIEQYLASGRPGRPG